MIKGLLPSVISIKRRVDVMILEFIRLLSFINRRIFRSEFVESLGPTKIVFMITIAPWIFIAEFYALFFVSVVTAPVYIIKIIHRVVMKIAEVYR